MQIFQQIGVAADDELAILALAARPARDSGRDRLLRQLIELGPGLAQRGFELEPGLGQGAASD